MSVLGFLRTPKSVELQFWPQTTSQSFKESMAHAFDLAIPVLPTTDIFTPLRNLDVFARRRDSPKLKVIAVLFNAFGLSPNKRRSPASLRLGSRVFKIE